MPPPADTPHAPQAAPARDGEPQPALALLRAAFDFVIQFTGDDLHVLSIDDRGRELLGIDAADDLAGLTWPQLMHGDAVPTLLYEIVPRLVRGEPWRGDLLLMRRPTGGLPVHAFALASPPTDGPRTITLCAVDRTETARLVEALRYEQGLLRALLHTIPESVYFKDLHSSFVRVSAAMARKHGVSRPEEMIGRTDFDHFSEEHARQAFADEQEIIRTGNGIIDFEEKETWPDGRVTWVSSTKLPLRDTSGRIIGTLGLSRDITERKRAEEERRQMEVQSNLAQKMESIGRLAAGVAHEINTPTQFINDNTHFLSDSFAQLARVFDAYRSLREAAAGLESCRPAVEAAHAAEEQAELDYLLQEVPRTLDQTLEGVARISRIVRSLKEFSHPSAPDKRPADINHAIEVATNVSRHEWKYVAEIETDLDPDLPLVPCMLDEINQVLLNLIINAAHAIGDAEKDSGAKGRITLRTRVEDRHACIEVQDTGTGIPPEVQARIFEPFFTTKAVGKGTGQGLAMVQTIIVRKHQGRVWFTTAPGTGTTFHIRLPLGPDDCTPTP